MQDKSKTVSKMQSESKLQYSIKAKKSKQNTKMLAKHRHFQSPKHLNIKKFKNHKIGSNFNSRPYIRS